MPPRKKAAKPATPPLDGCVIALSGSFPDHSQSEVENDLVTALGATISKSVTKSTTHLVTTDGDCTKLTTKVKQAQKNTIPIVKIDWLVDCLQKNDKLNEDDYLLSNKPAATTNGNSQAKAKPAKKRAAASDDEDDDTSAPTTKKAAKPNNTKTATNAQPAQAPTKPDLNKEIQSKLKVVDGENNIAKSDFINVPLDEHCPLANYRVYIDSDGLIYDASLNQTNSSANNNKFYRIQLICDGPRDYKTWTRWGRVGDRGQSAMLGSGSLDDALREFESKFKGKSGLTWDKRGEKAKSGKYTFIERSYAEDSDNEEELAPKVKDEENEDVKMPESTLDPAVQSLMQLIFNQQYFAATMTELNYDVNKLPLGKLSKTTITKGYQALKDLSDLINDHSLAQSMYGKTPAAAFEEVSNQFYSLIPHAFGRNRPPVIMNNGQLQREVDLLDSLSDMKEASNIMKRDTKSAEELHVLDQQFKGLNLDEMTTLDRSSNEFKMLQEYLVETRGHTHNHNYEVTDIFRIERQGEKERFKSAKRDTGKNTRLLWHGSRATNFGGILSQGLRIAPPEAPVNGYMFGKGVYLADMASKSANYCCSSISNGHALLLLCEAELGDPMQKLFDASYSAGEDAKAMGALSTWGRGTFGPQKWKDASCVHESLAGVKMPDTSSKPASYNLAKAYLMYNEYIAYDISQIRLRYLLRVKM